MHESVIDEKEKLRKKMNRIRSELSIYERKSKSQMICKLLQSLSIFNTENQQNITVFTYIPFRTEVDITPFIEWCWKRDINVLASKLQKSNRQMVLHQIRGLEDLESGEWGIYEPKQHTPQMAEDHYIDAVIMPGLAFDHHGSRLGYGGGYYDRWLEHRFAVSEGNPRTLLIAPAYHCQWISHVPSEPHDERINILCTEKGYWNFESS